MQGGEEEVARAVAGEDAARAGAAVGGGGQPDDEEPGPGSPKPGTGRPQYASSRKRLTLTRAPGRHRGRRRGQRSQATTSRLTRARESGTRRHRSPQRFRARESPGARALGARGGPDGRATIAQPIRRVRSADRAKGDSRAYLPRAERRAEGARTEVRAGRASSVPGAATGGSSRRAPGAVPLAARLPFSASLRPLICGRGCSGAEVISCPSIFFWMASL